MWSCSIKIRRPGVEFSSFGTMGTPQVNRFAEIFTAVTKEQAPSSFKDCYVWIRTTYVTLSINFPHCWKPMPKLPATPLRGLAADYMWANSRQLILHRLFITTFIGAMPRVTDDLLRICYSSCDTWRITYRQQRTTTQLQLRQRYVLTKAVL